jgi:hypothetical protein
LQWCRRGDRRDRRSDWPRGRDRGPPGNMLGPVPMPATCKEHPSWMFELDVPISIDRDRTQYSECRVCIGI